MGRDTPAELPLQGKDEENKKETNVSKEEEIYIERKSIRINMFTKMEK